MGNVLHGLTLSIAGIGTLALAATSALLYAGAMIGMKAWPSFGGIGLAALIAVFVICGVVSETMALRSERLGMIYVAILAIEVVAVALAARFAFGEAYTLRETIGCLFVIAGAAIAWA